jgi:hypothetical protein
MNRREIFAFLPLAPVLVGAAVISEAQADEKPSDPRQGTLSLNVGHGSVSMSVGRDGNLWVKSKDGDWKRVVTEG